MWSVLLNYMYGKGFRVRLLGKAGMTQVREKCSKPMCCLLAAI